MIRWLFKTINAQVYARLSREALVQRLTSAGNMGALAAVEELKQRLCFQDGSLQGVSMAGAQLQQVRLAKARLPLADLTGATLRGCYFGDADLSKARLTKADLSDGNLRGACMAGADLTGATLARAHLARADLRDAVLCAADLRDANLWSADLRGADLRGATLTGANLHHAQFDDRTRLPDGTPWHVGANVEAYTA